MAPEHEGDEPRGYGSSPHMRTVALSILVMGVSIAIVIILWVWFGHIGPSYSANRMLDQQAELRQQYGLPQTQPVPKSLLEVPPSLRSLATTTGNTTTPSSAAGNNVTGSGQTEPTSNQTGNATASNQTTSAAPIGGKVSISAGASTKASDAFVPNPAAVTVGDTVTWTNDDSIPHTVTSGQDAKPDGTFDSEIIAKGKSFSFTFEKAGDYPYFCTLHPTMIGTVNVT